jgi:fimbrial chaperone protein
MNSARRPFGSARLLAALTLALAVAAGGAASASQVGINPVQIYLSRGTSSTMLTLTNQDLTVPVQLQITGFAWKQQADGKMDLQPTEDVVFFPTLVTLAPGAERRLRVGSAVAPSAIEQTYRIFIEEMPALADPAAPEKGPTLQVRSKIGIPIFVAPLSQSVAPKILKPAWGAAGALRVTLENAGNVHVFGQQLQVQVKDGNGAALFDKSVIPWYLLAGDRREFTVELPKSACRRAKSIAVTLTTDRGVFAQTFESADGNCAM